MVNGHQIKRGAGYGGNDEEKEKKKTRGAANLTAHSAPVEIFITVNLLGTTLLTKADCAAIFSLSHSILCIC